MAGIRTLVMGLGDGRFSLVVSEPGLVLIPCAERSFKTKSKKNVLIQKRVL